MHYQEEQGWKNAMAFAQWVIAQGYEEEGAMILLGIRAFFESGFYFFT